MAELHLFSDDDVPRECGHAGQLEEEQQESEAAMDEEEGEEEAAMDEEEGEEEAAEEVGEEEEEVLEVVGGEVAADLTVDEAMPEVRRNAEMEGGGPRTWTSGGYDWRGGWASSAAGARAMAAGATSRRRRPRKSKLPAEAEREGREGPETWRAGGATSAGGAHVDGVARDLATAAGETCPPRSRRG